MIKEENFSKFFSNSSQMILKLSRNIQWVEILWNFKNFDVVIFNSKVWRHNRHSDVPATKEVESLHCFFVFGWITLKFGVRGNFRLLISNLDSKMQYPFKILRKCYFSSLRSWFLAQHSLMNWLPWQQWMTCLQSCNFKNIYRWLPKNDISLLNCFWDIQPKPSKTFYLFSCRILMTS